VPAGIHHDRTAAIQVSIYVDVLPEDIEMGREGIRLAVRRELGFLSLDKEEKVIGEITEAILKDTGTRSILRRAVAEANLHETPEGSEKRDVT
jgi:hypothetical protein